MFDAGQAFIDEARRLLAEHYLPRIHRCVTELTDEQVWWRPHATSNSIGNLLLHLNGNLRQWLVEGVGGTSRPPAARQRQLEFDRRVPIPRAELLAKLSETVAAAVAVLDHLPPAQLGETRTIQGGEVTVLRAVFHVVEHFSMHTGQIILLTKALTGDGLDFYQVTPDGVAQPAW